MHAKIWDFELFGVGHGGAGALFTVAQRRIENQDVVLCLCHVVISLFCPKPLARMLSSERARRRARSEAG